MGPALINLSVDKAQSPFSIYMTSYTFSRPRETRSLIQSQRLITRRTHDLRPPRKCSSFVCFIIDEHHRNRDVLDKTLWFREIISHKYTSIFVHEKRASSVAPASKHADDIVAQPDIQLFKFGRRPCLLVRAGGNLYFEVSRAFVAKQLAFSTFIQTQKRPFVFLLLFYYSAL